ncbi:hypothetical protein H9P43_009578 [Blastocladiella emersonii ATCC 22665]|nr:hypothetical protein H9P43_009578 [Blastocladiella emersonii ATCC 22665]
MKPSADHHHQALAVNDGDEEESIKSASASPRRRRPSSTKPGAPAPAPTSLAIGILLLLGLLTLVFAPAVRVHDPSLLPQRWTPARVLSERSCAGAWAATLAGRPPACDCSAQCTARLPVPGNDTSTCCPDYRRVSDTVVDHLVATGVVRERWRDLGRNTTSEWLLEYTRPSPWPVPAPWRIGVLAVGRQCLRRGAWEDNGISAGGWKLECADAADVVVVFASGVTKGTGEAEEDDQPDAAYAVTPFPGPTGPPVPRTLAVAVGSLARRAGAPPGLPDSFYYAQLADPASALKAILARLEYCGFACHLPAALPPGGRAPFDPTPGRRWRVSEPKYSLQRGAISPIDYDVAPEQVDDDYDHVVRESHGNIVPWSACMLRRVLLRNATGDGMEAAWVDVYNSSSGEWLDAVEPDAWFNAWQPGESLPFTATL